MCKAKTTTDAAIADRVVAQAANDEGTFVVVRDIDTADLHVKGNFATAAEAHALAEEFRAQGKKAAIAFIGSTPTGRVERVVADIPVSAPTVPVLVLK